MITCLTCAGSAVQVSAGWTERHEDRLSVCWGQQHTLQHNQQVDRQHPHGHLYRTSQVQVQSQRCRKSKFTLSQVQFIYRQKSSEANLHSKFKTSQSPRENPTSPPEQQTVLMIRVKTWSGLMYELIFLCFSGWAKSLNLENQRTEVPLLSYTNILRLQQQKIQNVEEWSINK